MYIIVRDKCIAYELLQYNDFMVGIVRNKRSHFSELIFFLSY